MQSKAVRMTIPAEADYIDVVRLSLYGLATRMGFSFEDIEDMKVAVSEACNNAIIHAYQDEQNGSIDVSFEMDQEQIRIVVKDYGKSFNFESTSERVTSLHDKQLSEVKVGGLGIYLMQALMDDVQVNTGTGTEVILVKSLTRSGGENFGSQTGSQSSSQSRNVIG